MSTSLKIIDRFNELPRAARWLVLAVIATALFLFWNDVLSSYKRDWDSRAQEITENVRLVRRAEELTSQLQKSTLRSTVLGVGAIEEPTGADEGRKAIADTVTDIMSNQFKIPHAFDVGESTLPREASINVVDGTKRLKTITGELRFEAKPEEMIAIIDALEQRPEIEGVNSVRLTKINGGKLKVRLNFDTWYVSSRSGR